MSRCEYPLSHGATVGRDFGNHSERRCRSDGLGRKFAAKPKILPYTDFGRKRERAVKEILGSFSAPKNAAVELPSETSHLQFLKFKDELLDFEMRVTENGVHSAVEKSRACKDSYEIECTREAARITNEITDLIEKMA